MSPHKVLMKYIFLFVTAAAAVASFTVKDEIELLQDLDVTRYAALHNMTLERVNAVTSDGWLLELHRVRNSEVFDRSLSTPVFISHGCACSSVDFMVNPRNESLIFMLADLGYDVWAVNYRANKFSNKVIVNGRKRDPTPENYYRATWQYMAERDVPAALEKVLEVTQQEKIYVIGQSMGATILFAALSENKRFDDKILLYGSLVPVIRFGEDTSASLKASFSAAPFIPLFATGENFEKLFGHQVLDLEVPGVKAFQEFLQGAICRNFPKVCDVVMGFLETSNKDQHNPHLNPTRDELYHTVYPAGVTAMNLYQFARQYKKEVWEKLDYDEVRQTKITNRQEYGGLVKPPKYNFPRLSVPLQVYFTRNDKYLGVKTAKTLVKDLGLKESDYVMIEGNRMEHHDVVWGWDARCWVYDHLHARIEGIESSRGHERSQYRRKMKAYARSLPFEDGCRKVGRTIVRQG